MRQGERKNSSLILKMKMKRFYCGDIYKVSLFVRDSGLSACLVPVCLLLSLFCEKSHKKEGRSERVSQNDREKKKVGTEGKTYTSLSARVSLVFRRS